jgi:hypothetical protein
MWLVEEWGGEGENVVTKLIIHNVYYSIQYTFASICTKNNNSIYFNTVLSIYIIS